MADISVHRGYEHDLLFRLRVKLPDGLTLAVTAWGANHCDSTGHNRIDVRARLIWKENGKRRIRTVFARGNTWCATAAGTCVDGDAAKELVLSLLSVRPGDTDAAYFATYTAAQLAFAETYGEELSVVAEERYGVS